MTTGEQPASSPTEQTVEAPGTPGGSQWLRYRWHVGVAAVALFTLLSRLPFRYRVPFDADSVNYALALRHFDLAIDQPHPPGNPLYVLLGRLASVVFHDPNQALVAVSLAGSVVAVVALAQLGAELFGRRVGLWAAVFLAVNPFFWLGGEVALSYAVEAAMATVFALLAWRVYRHPVTVNAVVLGLAIAFAGGLRPTLAPLLALVYLFGLWRLSWRDRVASVVVAFIGSLAWVVPLVALSGGVHSYLELVRRQASIAGGDTTVFSASLSGWLDNLRFFALTLISALNVLGVLAVVQGARRRREFIGRPSARTILLWAWLLPAVVTYAAVHFGQIGYVLLLLPPLFLLCLPLLDREPAMIGRNYLPGLGVAVSLIASVLLVVPMLGTAIATGAAWNAVAREVEVSPPAETVVIAWIPLSGSYRVASYLFPRDRVLGIENGVHGSFGVKFQTAEGRSFVVIDPTVPPCPIAVTGDAVHVVVLDAQVAARVEQPGAWTRSTLANGVTMLVRDVPAGVAYVEFSHGSIVLLRAGQGPPVLPACARLPGQAISLP